MRFPPQFLDDLKTRVSIYDYAGQRVAWDRRKSRPSAGDYWAPCPFHSEKTASFHVLERQGTYKCFGCGESGDLFGLCMQLEGVSFPEAVEQIAAFAGVALPEGEHAASKAELDARARLHQATDKAAAFFQARLKSAAGQAARAYLAKRGVPQEVWAAFGIGFAPEGWSTTFEALTAAGLKADDLIAAGLAKQGQRGPIDVFRNRIIFPITDAQGRTVAFGGRAMDPKDPAKYLNSPETALFHKGRTLYRLAQARRLLAKTKATGLVIAEGYLDVIAFERAGIAAVAPLGTALTEEQLQLAWRSGPQPVLCFDGDGAGQRAADKALDLALSHLSPDRTARFAVLAPGMDPDDLFQRDGPQALARLVESAGPAVEALFQREVKHQPLTTPEARAGLRRRLKAACARILDPETRATYLRDLLAKADAAIREAERPPGRSPPAGPGGLAGKTGPGGAFAGRARAGGRLEPAARLTQELAATGGRALTGPIAELLRVATDHPWLLDRHADQLSALTIADHDLDVIRHALIDCSSAGQEVDRGSLSRHLHAQQEDRARQRVLLWPPPVAPRKPRLREFDALTEASTADDAAPPPTGLAAADGPGHADRAAIEAEWMALLEQSMAAAAIDDDLKAAKAAAFSGDDPEGFARYQALLARSRAAASRSPSADSIGQANTDDPNQDAA